MQLGFVVRSTLVDVLSHSAPQRKLSEAHRVLAGDLGRRTGRSESYPLGSLGSQIIGVGPLVHQNAKEASKT